MTPTIFSALIGLWLFISAFAWAHPPLQFANTVISGMLAVMFALAGIYSRGARYLSAFLGLWLLFSTLLTSATTHATVWNNALSAVALVVASIVGKGPEGIQHERELYGRV